MVEQVMDQLFAKAVTLTDVHFGRNSNSPVANQDNLDFIDWFVEEAKTYGADTCIMMGDWHDNRHSIHVSTMDYSLRGIEKLNDAFKKVYWVPGNHDLLYRDRRDVTSTTFAKHLPNIEFVREPLIRGDVCILPWLVGGEENRTKKYTKSRYIFGHLELPGYMMNARVPMPHHADGVTTEDFKGPEYVFSGHFHFRQAKDNVVYTGNIMPFNFADVDDSDRGMMCLEWGKEPVFKAWPEQPLYRTMLLSEMLNEPDKKLVPKLTARVTLDIDITFEEAQVVRDEFMGKYGLRKIELVHQAKTSLDQEFGKDVVFQSVDQIVVDGLLKVVSNAVDPSRLVEIYQSLT
jgi:DNA repair exonuclease SbcCD nuclease subunit